LRIAPRQAERASNCKIGNAGGGSGRDLGGWVPPPMRLSLPPC